jgi:3-deoxy-D-manno-octulosonic-acid transferase
LDAPRFVRRFLDHWRPDLAILTESEIWPNLLWETSARGVPLALVNARMSDRSYDRWLRMRGLTAPLFSLFDVVLAQNEALARRFSDVGARKTVAVGSLKIDSPPLPLDEIELRRLRESLQGRIVLVAASTHEGEERIIAASHKRLSRERPELCTIIAPRHPERGLQIAEELESFGLKVEQRSRLMLPTPQTDVYIADTIGELGTIYALGQIAIIGGSLVERGGQNPIEAIRAGAVVISGPHWTNFRDAYEMLNYHKAAIVVANSDELAGAVARLLDDEVELQRMRAGAAQTLALLSGALDRTVAELLPFLPDTGGPDEKGLRRAC